MKSTIASALKNLKNKQQGEAKNCIERSQAKIRPVDISGQNYDEQIYQLQGEIQKFQPQSISQQFGLNENFLIGGRKFGMNKMPRIRQDSFYDNSLNFFQSMNQDNEDFQNYNPQDHPFNSSLFEFMEYVKQETQSINKMETSFNLLIAEAQNFLSFQSKKKTFTDSTKLQNDLDLYAKKNQTLLKSLQLEIKRGFQQNKRKQAQKQSIGSQIQSNIVHLQKNMIELQTLKQQKDKANKQLETISELKQRTLKKLNTDKFQISIIKLQGTNTLYRYGAKITKSQISKADYLQKKCYKFQGKVKPIGILDLKVFIMTTLYPMASSIFNDFSSQSNVYKAMFDLNMLSKEETQASLMILNKRVQKHLHQKKYHSLEQCLNSSVKIRRKKIIFIGSIIRFSEVRSQILFQIKNLNNNLLQVEKVCFGQVSNSFDGTNFSHQQLQVSYSYQKINVNVVFDVLFCVPTLVSKQQIEMLRKKVHKFEQVFCWFQIPKAELEEQRIQTYRQINSMLNKCKLFNFGVQKANIK